MLSDFCLVFICNLSFANSGLHGAIGEHRRSSRSSSVSSGGSSTNSAEGNDAVRQHTQNRLNGITSAQLHNQDLAVESLGSGSMPTLDKKDQADILSGKDAKLVSDVVRGII